jgi:hypothetical protein
MTPIRSAREHAVLTDDARMQRAVLQHSLGIKCSVRRSRPDASDVGDRHDGGDAQHDVQKRVARHGLKTRERATLAVSGDRRRSEDDMARCGACLLLGAAEADVLGAQLGFLRRRVGA